MAAAAHYRSQALANCKALYGQEIEITTAKDGKSSGLVIYYATASIRGEVYLETMGHISSDSALKNLLERSEKLLGDRRAEKEAEKKAEKKAEEWTGDDDTKTLA